MNELQKTEFDLLLQLDAVCRKLDITWFLVCGSALGAVKYAGFIPWDDDIDVAMYREDYERFVQTAPELLPEGVFLQNYRTDPAYPQIGSKLRNSNTTYIERTAAALPMNHGVFIDVFPLDGYPEGKLAGKLFEIKKRIYSAMMLSGCDFPRNGSGKILFRACRILGIYKHTNRVAELYHRMITRYPVRPDGIVCNHANWQGTQDYAPQAVFGDGASAEFESLSVKVPAEYHVYLTQKYGEYMLDPPQEEQVGHHYHLVCDCSRSYTDYFEKNDGGISYEDA